MAMAATRAFLSKLPTAAFTTTPRLISTPQLLRSRAPIAAAAAARFLAVGAAADKSVAFRCYSTQPTNTSLRDSSPNFSNRPPKETILLDGCDFEHWLVVVDPPPGNPSDPDSTRDEIIGSYIKTLAQVVGSEQEARMKIYSVSTRHYFAFGALIPEELTAKLKDVPNVRWVLPDSYLNVQEKDYGGEPFINGEAVPYDPKYHEEWVRNNSRANERSRRNDKPRTFDRQKNFDRRRETSQNFQNNNGPPPNYQGPPQGMGNPGAPPNMGNTHPQNRGPGNGFQGQPPSPQNYPQGGPPGYQTAPPPGYPGNAPGGYPGPGSGRPDGRPYQRGDAQYQDPNAAYQVPPQAGNPPYQGGRGQQSGYPPYQGAGAPEAGNPPYQGGPPPNNYGPPPNYAGGPPGYQGQRSNPNQGPPPPSYPGNYE